MGFGSAPNWAPFSLCDQWRVSRGGDWSYMSDTGFSYCSNTKHVVLCWVLTTHWLKSVSQMQEHMAWKPKWRERNEKIVVTSFWFFLNWDFHVYCRIFPIKTERFWVCSSNGLNMKHWTLSCQVTLSLDCTKFNKLSLMHSIMASNPKR